MSTPIRIDSLASPRPPRPPSAMGRAALATGPAIVTFAITILLFATLTHFDAHALNVFTVTVMAAVILSLLGTAGISPITLGIIGDGSSGRAAVDRVVWMGLAYSALISLAISTAVYRFLTGTVGLSTVDFAYFATLLFMQSLIWIMAGVYSATRQQGYFAVVFIGCYVVQFLLTYVLHRVNTSYTILGYTGGILALLVGSITTIRDVSHKPTAGEPDARPSILSLLGSNPWASVFPVLYGIAVFGDKLIVWLWMGAQSGSGLVIASPYTFGAFLGLLPIFSLGTTIHFETRATPLVKGVYQGRFSDIRRTASKYKGLYWRDLAMTLLFGLALLGIAVLLARLLSLGRSDEVMRVLLTVGAGAVAFTVIIFNYMVLSLFGNMRIPVISVLIVCLAEAASIPLLTFSTWFAALGFLAGSLTGGLLSLLVTWQTLRSFEYRIFYYATKSSLKLAREERVRISQEGKEERKK